MKNILLINYLLVIQVNPVVEMMQTLISKKIRLWRRLVEIFVPPSSSKWKEKSQYEIGRKPTPIIYEYRVKNERGNKFYQRIPKKKKIRTTSRKFPSSMHQSIFFHYFYSCTNFGYMEKDCREYLKEKYNYPHQSNRINFARTNHASSSMEKMEFFNFHKIFHMARDCNLAWVPKKAENMIRKKQKKVT